MSPQSFKLAGGRFWFLSFCVFTTFCSAADYQSGNDRDIRLSLRSDAKTHFRLHEYKSLREWEERRLILRKQILVAAGLDLFPPKRPLNPRRFGRQRHGRFTVEKVMIESFPGYFLAGNLYLPATSPGKHPGILVPHGHWKNGRVHNTSTYSVPALCANLASQGFAAFAYDMVGYNDTRQTLHVFGGSTSEMLWSYSPLGLQLWNSIRAMDFLESLKEVDAKRLGVTGASGGATQTILLAAVDDRVKASAPVDMVSASFQGDDACEIAPGLRTGTNNVEIASMIAPKPMLLVSATGDWTKHTPMVEFPAITAIYRLFGHGEMVSCAHIHSSHNYNRQSRESVYAFFNQYLLNEPPDGSSAESETINFRPRDLLIGKDAPPIPNDRPMVFDLWKEQMRGLNSLLSMSQLRGRLNAVLGSQWPRQVHAALQNGSRIVLERDDSGEQVSAQWIARPGITALVIVGGQISDPISDLPKEASLLRIEVYQAGTQKHSHTTDPAFLTYQRSDDCNRVQDILTSIAYVRQSGRERITLICTGHAEALCMLAAAVSPVPVSLKIDGTFPAGSDDEIARSVFIPGLQHAGGIAAVRALISASEVSAANGASSLPLFDLPSIFGAKGDY